jgi:hypothetical protein
MQKLALPREEKMREDGIAGVFVSLVLMDWAQLGWRADSLLSLDTVFAQPSFINPDIN